MNNRKWAKNLLKYIAEAQAKADKDERSHSHYWNGDTWGSVQGIKDANEWVENQLIDCILKHARPKEDS